MIDDLKKFDLIDVIRKYAGYFVENIDFGMTLIDQVNSEDKHESIIHISLLLKYKPIIEELLMLLIN